jgi:hypothetical protein
LMVPEQGVVIAATVAAMSDTPLNPG